MNMHVIFKELHSAGKPPSIWDDGQMFMQDLHWIQASWNLSEAPHFLGLYFPSSPKTAMQWTLPKISFSQAWGFPSRIPPTLAPPVICVLGGPGPDLPAQLCSRSLRAFCSQCPNPGQFRGRVLSCSVGHDGSRSIIGEPVSLVCCFFVCLFRSLVFFFNLYLKLEV